MSWDALEIVLSEVRYERHRQEQLKAEGRFEHTLADPEMSETYKMACILEEIGEVARNLLARASLVTDGDASDKALRKELIQVAALTVAWLEGETDTEGQGELIRSRATAHDSQRVEAKLAEVDREVLEADVDNA